MLCTTGYPYNVHIMNHSSAVSLENSPSLSTIPTSTLDEQLASTFELVASTRYSLALLSIVRTCARACTRTSEREFECSIEYYVSRVVYVIGVEVGVVCAVNEVWLVKEKEA